MRRSGELTRSLRRLAADSVLALLGPIVLLAPAALRSQVTTRSCDPALTRSAPQVREYQRRVDRSGDPRLDRCEGLHARPVAGSALRLESLTRIVVGDPAMSEELVLSWRLPTRGPQLLGDTVGLVATSLRANRGYQMDAAPPRQALSFEWPANIFVAEGFTRRDFGFLGWSYYESDGHPNRAYLPLDVRTRSNPPATDTGGYSAVIIASVAIRELYVTLMRLDDSGHVSAVAGVAQRLSIDVDRPGEPIAVRLPSMGDDGLYRVELAARHRSSGTSTLVFSVWHSAEARRP